MIQYNHFKLDNGLTVIVHEDKKVPMVGTFRNFFIEYTKDHMHLLTDLVDFDINDYRISF